MEEIKVLNNSLHKKTYIVGKPSFKQLTKKELDVFITDLEVQIRNFYFEKKPP